MDDSSLLRKFVDVGDQSAFRVLVERHIDLVYSAARRQVHDAHIAEDVTQAVFAVMARKAGRIHSGAALPAWLIATTRYVARDVIRAQSRRQKREQAAAQAMSKTTEDPSSADWQEITPLIDDALARMREPDRLLVTLRFLKGMSIAEVAAAAGISTAACEKRLARAIAKLRDSFQRRGIVLNGGAIIAAMTQGFQPAPAHLAQRAAEAALTAHTLIAGSRWFHFKLLATSSHAIAASIGIVLLGVATAVTLSKALTTQKSVQAHGVVAGPGRIKVGVILSAATATGWHPASDLAYDLSHQKIIFYLRSPQIEKFVILEPETGDTFKQTLPRLVSADHIVDGANADALRKLDVIVAGHNWHMHPQVLTAVDEAVRSGVGILEQAGFASLTPSYTPQVCQLSAFEQAQSFRSAKGGICRVVAEHPLLKGLKVGDEFSATMLYGAIGPIRGTPLITAADARNGDNPANREFDVYIANKLAHPSTMPQSGTSPEKAQVFSPLFVSQLGKGRIVSCQWHDATPAALDPTGDGTFYLHCIQWLAGRTVE